MIVWYISNSNLISGLFSRRYLYMEVCIIMFWEMYTDQCFQTRGQVEPVHGHWAGKVGSCCNLLSSFSERSLNLTLAIASTTYSPDVWPKTSDPSFLFWNLQLQASFPPTSLKSLINLPNQKVRSYTCLHRTHKDFWLSFMWHGYWGDTQVFLLSHYVSVVVFLSWGVKCGRCIL